MWARDRRERRSGSSGARGKEGGGHHVAGINSYVTKNEEVLGIIGVVKVYSWSL